jgi:hypothetical protein
MSSFGTFKLRAALAAASAALSLSAVLVAAPAASAAGDPVANGSFQLNVSPAFKKQLKHNGVKMTAGSFDVQHGSLDPTSGTGSLTLPPMVFKRGHKKMSFKGVTATLGPSGSLNANGAALFSLSGGKVARNNFGASVSGLKVTLVGSAAKKLDRKLGLKSRIKGEVGTASVVEEPETVEVTGGTVAVLGYNVTYPGSLAAKAASHCINPVTTISAIGPADASGAIPPSFNFPITGGTISPDGTGGVIQAAGGIRIQNKKNQSPGCSTASNSLTLDQTDFSFDFAAGVAKSHLVIGGKSSAPNGDQGTQFAFNLDSSNMTVTADPGSHQVTATGGVMKLNKGAALYLNQVFPQPLSNYVLSSDYIAGDPMGIVQVNLTTR